MDDMKNFIPGYGSESNVARLLMLMSLFLVIVPGIIAAKTARLSFSGEVTMANVIEVNQVSFVDEATNEKFTDNIPKVEFTALNGKTYQVDLLPYLVPPKVGEQVEVVYLISDPNTALPNAFNRGPLYISIFFMALGLILFLRSAKMMRKRY
ncbi:hypothetical protein K6Y31_19095 [Motilimonas cestriensis]|uniref:DUF3592 domain-containing protein n=1 Tax=Motilimonas cestriensis TaxID=2742685 RepID=A0ABS8WH05_9GAMM|nr:DUF3592 domain-containing protein [Motilimonas cestriensis]MCE2596884.1 hypothetical protein [Motilimonas cestriensis]